MGSSSCFGHEVDLEVGAPPRGHEPLSDAELRRMGHELAGQRGDRGIIALGDGPTALRPRGLTQAEAQRQAQQHKRPEPRPLQASCRIDSVGRHDLSPHALIAELFWP